MNQFAVMGNPIDHSLSPVIHPLFAKQVGLTLGYEKIKVPVAQLEQAVQEFFQKPHHKGLNITLPFKGRAYAMANQRSQRSQKAAVANTLWMKNGKLCADNTDGIGLIRDLQAHIHLENKRILLIGAGGGASGVLDSLLFEKPKQLMLCNRTIDKAIALQKRFEGIHICDFDRLTGAFDLSINATSASLGDQTLPLSETLIGPQTLCYDLAYHPTKSTPFVQWAQNLGSPALDGIGMLVEQAAEAFYIWHRIRPETTPVKTQLRSLIHPQKTQE
jgi:shikimate dehydrogenase